ncbi:hypothetical protein [Chryseobacterium lathyri]|uniref:Uncharacterized protein n=1 Tax=Chryseobacterium lathyri TaxID=395933 RepID=A0ABT9SQA4_9FLAO|nr:hypothetical protein [Chryseobacterium lathyri]MDP9961167.1 hypothetical protein [Chryseobacterium lathyri]
MNTKLLLLVSILFLSVNVHSQVGINTPTPSSTLDIKGSVEGNFREITGTGTLDNQDYHVSFSGISDAVLNLPAKSATDSTPADFRGRKYYIKNNSTANNLTLTAAAGQVIRSGGTAAANNTFIMQPGKYAVLTASGTNGWDLDVVVASVAANNWELVSTDANGATGAVTIPTGTAFTTLSSGRVTVTIPSGYTSSRVVLNFTGWGAAGNSDGLAGKGSLRFQVLQTGTKADGTAANATYASAMMTSWVMPTPASSTRFNYPVTLTLSTLSAGTYIFDIQMRREDENNATTSIANWGITGKADVYVK